MPATGVDAALRADTPPSLLVLPTFVGLGPENHTRQVALGEKHDGQDRPVEARLGTPGQILAWADPVTENPDLNDTEIWEIYNYTVAAHPVHIHEVLFQVVNRQPYEGTPRPPEAWESGYKDTVLAYPGEITRVKARFDLPGRCVWHCHIVEHEDNEMMRPMQIGHTIRLPFVGRGA